MSSGNNTAEKTSNLKWFVLAAAMTVPFRGAAQTDSIPARASSLSSFYVGAGPLLAFGPVYLNVTGGAIFRNGWGFAADYVHAEDRFGELSAGQSETFLKNTLFNARLVKEVPFYNERFRLQFAAGPSYGISKSTSWWQQLPGAGVEVTDYISKRLGVGVKAQVLYRINRWIGVSAGVSAGYNTAVRMNGLEAAVLVGQFGKRTNPYGATTYTKSGLDALSGEQFSSLLTQNRRQAAWGLALGGIVTAAALTLNTVGVAEYHGNDTWGRLGGTVAVAISHLALAPTGTGLLIWGFNKRGKVRQMEAYR